MGKTPELHSLAIYPDRVVFRFQSRTQPEIEWVTQVIMKTIELSCNCPYENQFKRKDATKRCAHIEEACEMFQRWDLARIALAMKKEPVTV